MSESNSRTPSPPARENFSPKTVTLGTVTVSRFILGGNPFAGFSHWSAERDNQMADWFTMERIKETYRLAELAGVTAHLARADNFMIRALREHWNESGELTWIAQSCPELGNLLQGVRNAIRGRAKCVFVHGGEMDQRVAAGDTAELVDAIQIIKDAGLAAGVAGHHVNTIKWAAEYLQVDFFMTCYYNPSDRTRQAVRNDADTEQYLDEDREAMCALIQELPAPAIHYKVLAAARNNPKEAFEYVARVYRPGDAVCVGICTKENPNMIQEDVNLLEGALRACGK